MKIITNTMASEHCIRQSILKAFRSDKTVAEAVEVICSEFGEDSVDDKTCRKWYQRFRNGNLNLVDQKTRNHRIKCDDQELQKLINKNPSLTQQELAAKLGVTRQTISLRLHRLKIRSKEVQQVPQSDQQILSKDKRDNVTIVSSGTGAKRKYCLRKSSTDKKKSIRQKQKTAKNAKESIKKMSVNSSYESSGTETSVT